jgi:uncharacterized membrane protein YeaQ/YmgE (transglycosylase-associated protein family)
MTADDFKALNIKNAGFGKGVWDKEDGTAYLVDGKTGKPLYSFEGSNTHTLSQEKVKDYIANNGKPSFEALELDETAKTPVPTHDDSKASEAEYEMWDMVWTSKEKTCGDKKDKNFVITMTGVCNHKAEKSSIGTSNIDYTGCVASFEYDSKNACATEIPVFEALNKIGKFRGAIYIIFGLTMTFFGSKFFFQLLGLIVGLISAGILFSVAQALFVPITSGMGMIIGVAVGCIIVGGLITYGSYKVLRKYSVPIMGAVTGIIGFVMIGKIFKQGGYVNLALGIVGAIAGWFLATKLKNFIRALGTAILGSFLVVRGIGNYAPGFPS